jgi:hypothetical protein
MMQSYSLKFKGKYFVSVIGKFQFSAPSGNTGLLSPEQVGGLTQFLLVRCSLFNCSCDKHRAVFKAAACVFASQYLERSRVKQLN